MPRNASLLRAGLQLLNWDALRFYSTFYFELNESTQDFLVRAIRVAGNEHWPQLPAAEWIAEMDAVVAEAVKGLGSLELEEKKVEAEGDGSGFRWFGLDGSVSR